MEAGTSSCTDDGNKKGDKGMLAKVTTEFKNEVIKETIKLQHSDAKSKTTEEVVELIKEVAKVLVIEAAIRAAKQASAENKSSVNISHVETILPQLMLDFP